MANDLMNSYFEKLNNTLKQHHRAIPSLLIDLDILDENIEEFQRNFVHEKNFRVVVKSLPSLKLVKYVMNKMNTTNLMVFHQPFLSDLTKTLNNKADVLLGKPMPIKTAAYYFNNLPTIKNNFDPYKQIQWLVDTKERVLQYIELAQTLSRKLRLNFEIDVGLHRGGFQNISDLQNALELMKDNANYVEFSGFMGYDPHIVKIPKIIRSQKKSQKSSTEFYNDCKKLIEEKYPELWHDNLTFNGAGSPTVSLHNSTSSPLNEVAAGSCFVKPTTFDIPTLSNYKPACFISTPVLKKFDGVTIPGIENFKTILRFINTQNAQSFFIYGGYWKADYVFPEKLQQNSLYGDSTNQTMVNAPNNVDLDVDDFVFLRPHQSEFVFLQFGNLLIVRGNEIIDEWSLLNNC